LDATSKVVLTYFAVGITILMAGLMPSTERYATYSIPVLFSILLLVPLYHWQRSYRAKTVLAAEAKTRDKTATLFWILALFLLALTIRIPSVLIFNTPYEKTPVIYLTILTILIIEKTNLTAFGFKTNSFLKSLAYGLIFFIFISGVTSLVSYALVYMSTGQMPIQSVDIVPMLSAMPFMTLCVGISEESLFRGYMQTHLEKLCNPNLAILIQAVLFGVWHFVWNLSPFDPLAMIQYVATTFFIGLFFGYFYSKTRNLIPLVLAHGLFDSVPGGIAESEHAFNLLQSTPLATQAFVSILPYVVSTILTLLFITYFAKEL